MAPFDEGKVTDPNNPDEQPLGLGFDPEEQQVNQQESREKTPESPEQKYERRMQGLDALIKESVDEWDLPGPIDQEIAQITRELHAVYTEKARETGLVPPKGHLFDKQKLDMSRNPDFLDETDKKNILAKVDENGDFFQQGDLLGEALIMFARARLEIISELRVGKNEKQIKSLREKIEKNK